MDKVLFKCPAGIRSPPTERHACTTVGMLSTMLDPMSVAKFSVRCGAKGARLRLRLTRQRSAGVHRSVEHNGVVYCNTVNGEVLL